MSLEITQLAYEVLSRERLQPNRSWLGLSATELGSVSEQLVPFWLTLTIAPAFNLDGKRAVFRLPSRDYPFVIYSATTDIELSTIRLFTTSNQLSADDLPLVAITGGNTARRNRLRWQTPLLLTQHEAWRAEITFKTPPRTPIHVNFEGLRMVIKK